LDTQLTRTRPKPGSAPFPPNIFRSCTGGLNMLINCVAYQDGKKLADIPKEDISEYVKRPDCFVWVALLEPSAADLAEMQEEFGLHELAVEDASHGHQRPKLEEYGHSLFVVLQTIDVHETELQIGEVDIFVGENYILSVRRHSERGFQS